MGVLVFVGTKAQFIKTAPIIRELDRRGIGYWLVYTGQHSETFDLLEQAFGTRPADEVIVPRFEADTKASFLRWAMQFWLRALSRIRSDQWRRMQICLVHGDTASTLFGGMVGRLAGVKVGHVEAGLRSPKLLDPFPEEAIRRLVSRLSQLHFAPDAAASANLSSASGQVVNTGGNTLRDALAMSLDHAGEVPVRGGHGGYGLVSIHRNENLSSKANLDLLMKAVLDAAELIPLRFVLHPATRAKIAKTGWQAKLEASSRIELLARMGYPQFVRLMLGSCFLMTDGGSNQEEAAMLGLPTLLLRRTTERSDGLGDGVELSRLNPALIKDFTVRHANKPWRVRRIETASPSASIVDWIVEHSGARCQ